MAMRRSLVPAAVAVAAIAALGWWALGARQPGAPAQQTTAAGTAHGTAPAANRHPPLPPGTFDATRAVLEDAAQRGDPEASFRIGRALAYCMRYRPVPGGELTRMLAQAIAEAGDSVRIAGRPLGDERSIDLFLYAHAEGERLCTGTDSLRKTPPAGTAYDHIARAAAQGHPGAMALYPQVAFEEFQNQAALLEHAAEVARRRDRAGTMLEAAIRAGEADALRNAAVAYAANGWLPEDPMRSLTYWFAYLGTPAGQRLPDSLRADMEATLLQAHSTDTVQKARSRALELLAAHDWQSGEPR
ncbi:hypothetical protein CO641_07670 [Lysobacteraceae bacterium NML91-0213]|nr:hypothetical protein CO641_07670 [Xanthomonadaceae bacterium NML91-0213]